MMDRLGIALSTLCLVHCLLLPVLLAVLPLVAISYVPEWFNESEWLHLALLVPVALVSGPVLARAARRVRWIGPVVVLAFAALVAALFVPEQWQEISLTTIGAILLLLSHAANLKLRAEP